jgi:outer membrane protein TolC
LVQKDPVRSLTGEYISRDTRLDGHFSEWSGGISRAFRLPGKSDADQRIGDLGIDVANNASEEARHQAALLLKDLWFAWLAAEADYSLAHSEQINYETQLAATERRQSLGEAAALSVNQVQAALAQIRADDTNADRVRTEARLALKHNFPKLVLPVLAPEFPEPTPPGSNLTRDEWVSAILGNSHEIRMAESEAERQQWLAQRAQLDRFADPTLGLRAFQERGGEESGFGVFLSIPIGGRLRDAESQSLAAHTVAAQVDARKVMRDIALLAETDVVRMEMGMEAWRHSFAAREASAQALTRMQRAFEVGESDLTELLVLRRQDFAVRRAEAQFRAAAHDAVLQLQIDSHSIWGLAD